MYMSFSHLTSALRHHRVMFRGVPIRSLSLQYHLPIVGFQVALFHSNTTYAHVSITFNERLGTPQSGFVWCLKSLSFTSTTLVNCGVPALFHSNTTHPWWCPNSLSSTPIPLIRGGVPIRSLPLQYHLSVMESQVSLLHSNTTSIHVSFTFNERLETPQNDVLWCPKSLVKCERDMYIRGIGVEESDLGHHHG